MQQVKNNIKEEETTVLLEITAKYLPYWPLFLTIIFISIGAAFIYLRYAQPVYEITAGIVIKDENTKGLDDTKLLETFNPFGGKKIVDNEIEVLRSRSIMKQTVQNLLLCTPVYQQGNIHNVSAYVSSPVKIEAKNIDGMMADSLSRDNKFYFSYNEKKEMVLFDKNYYSPGQWFILGQDSVRFIHNRNYKPSAENKQLFFSLMPVKKVVNDLLKKIKIVASSKLSTVIDLTLNDEIPRRGEDILNELLNVYNETSVRDKNALAANTLAFVEQRLHVVVGELDSVEGAIQRYKKSKEIVDISEQGKVFLEHVGAADQKVSDLNMQLAVLNQTEKYVVEKTQGLVPSTLGVTDPILNQLLATLYEAEVQYEKLKKITAVNNPIMIGLRDQMEKIKPSILENIRNQRNNLNASKTNLVSTSNIYSSQLSAIPQKERGLLEISRQQVIKNNIYTFLLQKREETALNFASEVSDSKIVDSAESSILPISPKKMIIYPLALVAGILFTAGLLMLKEISNNKINSRREIKKLTKWPVIGELCENNFKNPIIAETGKGYPIAEQFGQIRTSLILSGIDDIAKKILVTSSSTGEGKTFIAINLATSLSLADKKVILLDLNLRKPMLGSMLKTLPGGGLTSYLTGKADADDIILKTSVSEGLFFIPCGHLPHNPSELILTKKMQQLIQLLDAQFDYIVIDSPPVLPFTDATILSAYCDITLYVVRHAFTPKAHIKMLDEGKSDDLKNVSVIYNGVRQKDNVYNYERAYKSELKSKKIISWMHRDYSRINILKKSEAS